MLNKNSLFSFLAITLLIILGSSDYSKAQILPNRSVEFNNNAPTLRIIPQKISNSNQFGSFQIQLTAQSPLEARLRMYIDNSSGKEVHRGDFPQIVPLPSPNTIYTRTWNITNSTLLAGIRDGTHQFSFECLSLSNEFLCGESLPMTISSTPTKPPAKPQGKRADEIAPRVDLTVKGSTGNLLRGQLCNFVIDIKSTRKTSLAFSMTVIDSQGKAVYKIPYSAPIVLNNTKSNRYNWTIPNSVQTQAIGDGKNLFVFELTDSKGLLKREYTVPAVLSTERLSPTPSPPFVFNSPLFLKNSHGGDVPVVVEHIKLPKEGHDFLDDLNYYGWDTSYDVYVLKLSATSRFYLDSSSSMGIRSREILLQWIQSQLYKNHNLPLDKGWNSRMSIISHLYGPRSLSSITPGIASYVNFLKSFYPIEEHPRLSSDINYWGLSKNLDFGVRTIQVILIDPTPSVSPDLESYVVILDSTYSE